MTIIMGRKSGCRAWKRGGSEEGGREARWRDSTLVVEGELIRREGEQFKRDESEEEDHGVERGGKAWDAGDSRCDGELRGKSLGFDREFVGRDGEKSEGGDGNENNHGGKRWLKKKWWCLVGLDWENERGLLSASLAAARRLRGRSVRRR